MNDLKEKYEEFKSEKGRVFGLIYPYILIAIVAIGLIYISNLNEIARQSVNPALPDTTKQEDLKVIESRTIPPVDIMEVSKPTEELVSKGKETFTTVCASCHGENGEGDGPASTGLNPQPRNFTSKEGWTNGPKLSQIYQTLEEGVQGTAMVSYNYLPPRERIALAHYIRQTFVPDPPQDSEGELQALDQTYSLSKGMEVSAQIPVQAAMNIIINENDARVRDITGEINRINNSNEAGAQLFRSVTKNQFKALTTLGSSLDWKKNYQKFTDIIIYNLNENGFSSKVFKLSGSEWKVFYNYMQRLFDQGDKL